MKHNPSVDDLRWVRVFTPDHIPKYLVEQVRDRDFSIEDFYKYQEINCTRPSPDGMKLNPLSHLYVLVDPENIVKGFLWFVVDALSKDLVIQTFSVDKEYWYKGKAVSKLSNHIKEIRKKANLNKIYWITNYPKHSERYGFKRSKGVLMEYTEEKDGEDNLVGGNGVRGECEPTIAGTTTVSELSTGTGECTASG
jgi:hypothetical protein